MIIRSTLCIAVCACALISGGEVYATDFRLPQDVSSKIEKTHETIKIERRNGFNVMREKNMPVTNNTPPKSSFTLETTNKHVLQTINGVAKGPQGSGFVVTPENTACGKNCAQNSIWNVMGPDKQGTRNMFYVPSDRGTFSGLSDKK